MDCSKGLPAAAYRKGLLDVLALDMAIRTRRITTNFVDENSTARRTPEQLADALRQAFRPERVDELRDVVRAGLERDRDQSGRAGRPRPRRRLTALAPLSPRNAKGLGDDSPLSFLVAGARN